MIAITRPLKRESAAAVHSGGRARMIIIELRPPGDLVGFRLERTRTTYSLPVAWCYREAVRAEMARQKAERKAARKKERAT